MKIKYTPRIGGALAIALTLMFTSSARAAEVNVTPGDLNGWQLELTGGSIVTFVDGPDDPPLGNGSAQFSMDAAGSTARLRNDTYDGLLLEAISALSYSTYVQSNTAERAAYIALHVDHNNDGIQDDVIVFEPRLQGDAVALDTWQTWDALNGGWYSTTGQAGSNPDNVISLTDYIAEFPDAAIVNLGGAGGVTIVAGSNDANWANFLGNADAFTLGDTTYDFELEEDSDNDGVPDGDDHCPDSDLREFVDVGNGPTTVENTVDEDGCSIQDLVNEAMANARNHGQYVSAIAHLANDLRKSGEITNRESTILKNGAARSSIGKPTPKTKPLKSKGKK